MKEKYYGIKDSLNYDEIEGYSSFTNGLNSYYFNKKSNKNV
jgi:hypothetical protein